jgi:hypothetical protein
LAFALITPSDWPACFAANSAGHEGDDVNFIDMGDNLRNLICQKKIGGRGGELKGINLWQQYQT